jgi:hypothetical protein
MMLFSLPAVLSPTSFPTCLAGHLPIEVVASNPCFFLSVINYSVRDVMQVELLMHAGPEHASVIA